MKMSQERDEVEVDDEYVGDDPESNVRKSERKRQREKQRRSDLANAFDELAALLFKIEPDDAEGPGSRRKQRRRSGATDVSEAESGDAAGITRLDLIGRTVETLRRLHKENIELKHSLRNQASGDNNVRLSLGYHSRLEKRMLHTEYPTFCAINNLTHSSLYPTHTMNTGGFGNGTNSNSCRGWRTSSEYEWTGKCFCGWLKQRNAMMVNLRWD